MTPLPKRKHTRSRSNIRRGGQPKISLGNLVKCSNCGKLKESHRACPYCGLYGADKKAK
ncbi:TPA: 50S ribosomal protein L32 [Candidatus Woesebacteria bacterium]|nr:50S ribosomal protein L32 [Candidatus Woesebacteria bacterium]HCC08566.1 50S ribosomal protein L32 [Candidatus Woesebacteria bacterium]